MQPVNPGDGEENYYTALASEYLIDDLSEVVRGSEFATAVSERLASQGIAVPPGALQGSTQAGKLHRILNVGITWGNPDELTAIGDAVAATLEESAPDFMPRLFAQNGAAYLVNRGGVAADRPQPARPAGAAAAAADRPGRRHRAGVPGRLPGQSCPRPRGCGETGVDRGG